MGSGDLGHVHGLAPHHWSLSPMLDRAATASTTGFGINASFLRRVPRVREPTLFERRSFSGSGVVPRFVPDSAAPFAGGSFLSSSPIRWFGSVIHRLASAA